MSNLTTKDFTTLVRDQVAAIQGASASLVDLTIGSILRSITEANASIALWIQGLILKLLATTRAATSSGADLDSWCGDYGLTRLAAVAATGNVTFARFTAAGQVVIPVGATSQTDDGSQKFAVVADTANANYSASLGGYILAAASLSVIVPVQASVAGAAGNAQAGQINTITQAIPGVDTVTNAAAFTNGADAESDSAYRERFVAFINSLSKATKSAIGYAITSLQQGAAYKLIENETYAGAADNGYFYVVVDDGTGTPSAGFLSSVNNAVDAYRGFTIRFGIYAPVVVSANVVMTITTAAGYDHAATVATVTTAISDYLSTLEIGETLSYTRLAQVAYDAADGITNVSGVTLNGGTSDLSATNKQIIKPGTITVS